MKHKFKYLISIVIVSSFLLGFSNKVIALSKDNGIYKNIYIEDIDVSFLNMKDAIDLVKSKYKEKTIKLIYEDKTYTLSPKDIDLSFNIDKAVKKAFLYTRHDDIFTNVKRKFNLRLKDKNKIKLVSTYNEYKLSSIINNICKDIDIEKTDATININDNGSIKRTKAKNGKKVNKIKLKETIYDMIVNKNLSDINIPVDITTPKISTEDVKSINTILGQFSTTFNHTTSRGSNINIAGKSTSDKLIMPHDEFSYNKSTGSRTWHNGYKTAKVIIGGKYVNGEGGGVCQVSTTIYNAALISGMDITEVHNHTFASRYAPIGRDAAVSYGYTDFKFQNPLKHPIYIKNIVNNGVITSKIYGCDEDREKIYITTKTIYEKDKIKVDTLRIYLDEEGNKIREEIVNKNVYKKK